MIKLYGIKQCSTMKKAFDWLEAHAIPYEFHDYKKFGISRDELEAWCERTDWQRLLNTRGTTWRKLSETERADVDQAKALTLMQTHPSLIKRPVVASATALLVGFDDSEFSTLLENKQ